MVGLAIGRALSLSGREVVVLETESAIGTSTSSRNSEVVHSGMDSFQAISSSYAGDYVPAMPANICLCNNIQTGVIHHIGLKDCGHN